MITYEDKVAINENAEIPEINKVTADNMNEIKSVVNGLANLFFPIGKIEMFFDSNDHSNYLDFTWERTLVGKMPIGYDSTDDDFKTIGTTGGEKTHTLTIDEMPAHEHDYKDETGKTTINGFFGRDGGIQSDAYMGVSNAITSYSNAKYVMSKAGGSQAHNNMPPYQVVAFWKRIS